MTTYSLKTAAAGLWREKWINLLSVFTIATGLFLITVCLLAAYNTRLAVKELPDKFSVTVFLDGDISAPETETVKEKVRAFPTVKKIKYVSKEAALDELRAAMKDADFVLQGLDENPLPASLEVKLDEKSVTGDSVKGLAEKIKKVKGVSDVQYGREFLSAIQSINKNLKLIGVVLVGSLMAGIAFVCYSTVKILFYRRKDEIETLKFLGATKGFIRVPFVIEGGFLGLAGGLVCTVGVFVFYYFMSTKFSVSVPLLRSIVMPAEFLAYPPVAGLLMGMAGSLIAVGRVKF